MPLTDYLLVPENTLNGPHWVDITVRPVRVAYLVDPRFIQGHRREPTVATHLFGVPLELRIRRIRLRWRLNCAHYGSTSTELISNIEQIPAIAPRLDDVLIDLGMRRRAARIFSERMPLVLTDVLLHRDVGNVVSVALRRSQQFQLEAGQ